MKKNILLLFLLPVFAFAGMPDTTGIPSEWNKESIVILEYIFRYDLKTSNYLSTMYGTPGKDKENLKISYLVRDKWGVDELSQITLPSEVSGATLNDRLGTIYKKNGKTVDLEKEHLIINERSVDLSIRGKVKNFSFLNDAKEKTAKLAVPNLEAGDILEIDISFDTRSAPGFIILQNNFPILHANYEINIKNDTYSYPLLLKTKYINCNYGNIPGGIGWSLKLDSVKKATEEILNDDLGQIPYVTLDYYYENRDGFAFIPFNETSDERKKELQAGFVRSLYAEKESEARVLAAKLNLALKKKHPVLKDTLQFIKDAFYLYREMDLGTVLYADNTAADDELFTVTMSEVFFKNKIAFRAFVAQPDRYGAPETLHNMRERTMGVCLPWRNLYLFHPKLAFEPGSVPSYFENQKVATFTLNKYYKKSKMRWWPFWTVVSAGYLAVQVSVTLVPVFIAAVAAAVIIPAAINASKKAKAKSFCKYDFNLISVISDSSARNRNDNIFNLKIDPTKGTEVQIEKTNLCYGKMKNAEARSLYYYSSEYYKQENPYRKLLNYTPLEKSTEEEQKEEREYMKKRMKAEIEEDELKVKEFTAYSVDEANLFEKEKPLKYSQHFTLENFCWASGDYLIVDAGKLIGGQLNVPDNGKERTQNFNIPFRKEYNNTINVPLPEGYQPENLNDFNFNVSSAAGSFISSAKLEGSKLVITTSKVYNFLTYEKEKANDVYGFLKEAEKFRNRKLILRKK